jgi:hypothetical protein
MVHKRLGMVQDGESLQSIQDSTKSSRQPSIVGASSISAMIGTFSANPIRQEGRVRSDDVIRQSACDAVQWQESEGKIRVELVWSQKLFFFAPRASLHTSQSK